MDSRLLNAFHDDPFDENYTNFEADREIWSSEGDSLLYTSDTFNDVVLPMNSEMHGSNFYEGSQTDPNNLILHPGLQKKQMLLDGNYSGQQSHDFNDIHVVSVKDNISNYKYAEGRHGLGKNFHKLHYNDAHEDEDEDEDDNCSEKTFRTRTDSSSIADYESHSSDYDEDAGDDKYEDEDTDDSEDEDEDVDEEDNEDVEDYQGVSSLNLIEGRTTVDSRDFEEAVPSDLNKVDLEELSKTPTDENFLLNNIPRSLIENDDILSNIHSTIDSIIGASKNRTISTNTLSSDTDALSLNIDANNFDLAEFITKDDILIDSEAIAASHNKSMNILNPSSLISIDCDSDSDSDSDTIVDVENLALDEEMELKQQLLEAAAHSKKAKNVGQTEVDLQFTDNTIKDPSWSPMPAANRKTDTINKEKVNNNNNTNHINSANMVTNIRNFPSLIPNKKQTEMLKRFGCGRGGKNLLAQRNAKIAAKKFREQQQQRKKLSVLNDVNNSEDKLDSLKREMGRGKNLSLLKQKNVSISEHSSEESSSPAKPTSSDEGFSPSKVSETDIENENDKDVKQLPQNIQQIKQDKIEPVVGTALVQSTATVSKASEELHKTCVMENKEIVKENVPVSAEVIKPVAAPVSISVSEDVVKPVVVPVKRKLNLEEYKMKRRGDIPTQTVVSTESKTTKSIIGTPPKSTEALKQSPIKQSSDEIKSIVKTLKEPLDCKESLDPIIQAKNKVLRMQELKKAQQLKIIDSTISKKVPRVTKLLPLKEIVKDIYPVDDNETDKYLKRDPNYEEITITSIGCNTNISIPPKKVFENKVNPRSILKSSAHLNIATHSLLASIQHEVVKTTHTNANDLDNKDACGYQGENKIIMHLRKDRPRCQTATGECQTDLTPEFPMLPLPKEVHRRKKRNYIKRRDSSSDSGHSNDSCSESRGRSRSSLASRRRSSNCSSERGKQGTDTIGGGYSSRSSRRHRSSLSSSSDSEHHPRGMKRKRRFSYKKSSKRSKRSRSRTFCSSSSASDSEYSDSSTRRQSRRHSRSPYHSALESSSRSRSKSHQLNSSNYNNNNKNTYVDRNVSQPAVEERRIVYVGRIEEETTKEVLRRKFLAYGSIKQVTVHYKENGMKYGFVTFDRSQDAFAAIDNSQRDPQISMYDVSFGGRRAFCRASYADLDNAGINTYESYVYPTKPVAEPKEDDSFEALLLKVKAKLNASKTKAGQ